MKNNVEIPKGKFYVYTLARPDGTVFYVGKGKNFRIDAHEKEATRDCGCPKCCVIRTIWADGGAVVKAVVFESEIENDVLAREREMIIADRANLCNRAHGSRGRRHYDRWANVAERSPWELYDAMYLECLQEIREIEQRRRQAIGYERFALREEVKTKRKLLREWQEQTKRAKASIRAFLKEQGRVDKLQRRPKKPW